MGTLINFSRYQRRYNRAARRRWLEALIHIEQAIELLDGPGDSVARASDLLEFCAELITEETLECSPENEWCQNIERQPDCVSKRTAPPV